MGRNPQSGFSQYLYANPTSSEGFSRHFQTPHLSERQLNVASLIVGVFRAESIFLSPSDRIPHSLPSLRSYNLFSFTLAGRFSILFCFHRWTIRTFSSCHVVFSEAFRPPWGYTPPQWVFGGPQVVLLVPWCIGDSKGCSDGCFLGQKSHTVVVLGISMGITPPHKASYVAFTVLIPL